jgi:hypothetical protein
MEWGTDPWGITDEEYAHVIKVIADAQASTSDMSYLEANKVIADSQASTSDMSYLEAHKVIGNTITITSIEAKTFIHDPIDFGTVTVTTEPSDQFLFDGEGYNYVFADNVTDGNSQIVMNYTEPASVTTAWSQSSGATPSVTYTDQSDPTV